MSNNEQEKNITLTESDNVSSKKVSGGNPFVELFNFLLIALLIVLPIRWFVAQPFIVSGASMEDTFHNNEYLIVDQLTYHLKDPVRGEVIIFRYPNDPSKFFIKRIIGLPSETVSIQNEEIFITNEKNPEGFLLSEPYIEPAEDNGQYTFTLAKDEYFVMGDNRDHSSDSRVWGALKRDAIIGRAWLRLLPPAQLSIMPGQHSIQN